MKKQKSYYHVLEGKSTWCLNYGTQGDIGYKGVYRTLKEAKKEIARLSDFWPEIYFWVFPSNTTKKPVIVTH